MSISAAPFVAHPFDNYKVYVFGEGPDPSFDRAAVIGCFQGDKFVGRLTFYTDDATIPQNGYLWEQGLRQVYLNFPMKRYDDIITMLREEETLFLRINTVSKDGFVSTSDEQPIGKAEDEFDDVPTK